MAITQIQMGGRSAAGQGKGGNIMSFLLEMMSIEERSKHTDILKEQTAISREHLGIAKAEDVRAQETYETGKPLRKAKAEVTQDRYLSHQLLEQAKRALAVAKTTGNEGNIKTTRQKVRQMQKLQSASPSAFETIAFADELYKKSMGENKALMGQIYELDAANKNTMSQLELTKQRYAAKDAMQGNIEQILTTYGEGMTGADAAAALKLSRQGDYDGAFAMLQRLSTGAAVGKNVFEFSKLATSDQQRFSEQTQGLLASAEARGQSQSLLPELRFVNRDTLMPFDAVREIMTRGEAEQRGMLKAWEDATVIDPTKLDNSDTGDADKSTSKSVKKTSGSFVGAPIGMTDNQLRANDVGFRGSSAGMSSPYKSPTQRNTVKKAADEKVKKITPAGGKDGGKAEKVRVINPDGTAGWIPADQLEAALKAGYKRLE